jgi:hypothetical protein
LQGLVLLYFYLVLVWSQDVLPVVLSGELRAVLGVSQVAQDALLDLLDALQVVLQVALA